MPHVTPQIKSFEVTDEVYEVVGYKLAVVKDWVMQPPSRRIHAAALVHTGNITDSVHVGVVTAVGERMMNERRAAEGFDMLWRRMFGDDEVMIWHSH